MFSRLLLRLLSLVCLSVLSVQAQQWSLGFWNGGNSVPASSLQWNALTHVAYIGAAANSDGSLAYLCPSGVCTSSQADSLATSFISLAHTNGVKVVMSINSTPANLVSDFPSATNSTHRAAFISNIVNYVNRDGFDGVDIDWEINLNLSQETSFLADLRTAMGSKLITIAAIAQFATASGYAGMQSYVDAIEVSSIDQGGGNPTWFGNPVFNDNPDTDSGDSIDRSLTVMRGGGVLNSKMLAGLAFYGELQTGATGPRQSASVSTTQLRYTQISASYPSYLSSPTRDTVAKLPWFSPSSNSWVNYGDPTSLGVAVNYIKNSGIKGLWIWALDQDYFSGQNPSHPLMNAVATALGTGGGTGGGTAPVISSSSLPSGSVGAAYYQTVNASGTTPITWGLTSGTLPAGLALDSTTGVISGTPTAAGTSDFTIQATNALGNNSKSLSLTVTAATPTISSFTASPSSVSAGSSSTLSWSTSGASVLQIDQGIGTVTGTSKSVTPTSTTTYKLTATSSGGSTSKTVTVTVTIGGSLGTPPAVGFTDSDLLVAADHCSTSLSADITDTTLSIPVTSLSTCGQYQVLFIDSEQVKNCSGASNVFTICSGGRGFSGTAPASHKQGALVRGRIGAVYHNTMRQAIITLSTTIAGQTHHGTYPGGTSIGGACWPNHICTVPELYAASDFADSTLTAAMGATDTSLTVASGTYYQSAQVVLVDQELIKVGSASGNTLSVLTRGIGGTTAGAHATGASVTGVIAALEFERQKLELHAMEADVYGTAGSTQSGICGTSCAAVTGVSWPNHVFTPDEAGTAANGGPFPALWRNRFKDEIIAFLSDLVAHP